MPNNNEECVEEQVNELRYYTVQVLHKFFFNKRDFLPDNVTVTNKNLQDGLLRDKSSILINKNQIEDLDTLALKEHNHGELYSNGSMKKSNLIQPNKNVVTDANGFLTTESKVNNVSPNNNANNIKPDSYLGPSAGISDYYARADHVHKQEHDNMKADAVHTHPTSDITGLNNSLHDLSFDVTNLTTSLDTHNHGPIGHNGSLGAVNGNKNVVTDSNGFLITENKILPSTTKPFADSTEGNVGSGTKYAREDHVHPISNIYARNSHSHSISDVTNLQTELSNKSNKNHSHGIIQSDGTVANSSAPINQNKNIITNSDGKIALEDRIAPTDFTNLQSTVNKFSWVNVLTDYAHIDGIDSSASIIKNSNIKTFYMNEGLRICFIRFEIPLPSKTNSWIKLDTLPNKFGPVWTQYLIPYHVGHLVRVVDDDGIGSNHKNKREIQYLVRKEAPVAEDVSANGFFFYS